MPLRLCVADVPYNSDSCAMYDDRFCGELNPPSIHPNLPLCNYSAKHGTIQAHRLGELPYPVEPRAFLLDMVINAVFDQGFLVI